MAELLKSPKVFRRKMSCVSDGAHFGGNVLVGENVLIGIGASINKRVQIGSNAVVVSGAVVTDHVPEGAV